ncbi:molybdenum cofactor guanylyltransferase [Oscillatoria sp. FACHB-1406]|uniref:molybdenum cofactor guanylyltransferase n=1 Tax=Oscillatoria sp. FACHB-1406 TaxID=2692846 RepID=UPI00168749BF|nr:molybdenum cofactor guanylyltransferase [Oscillatoria sp. FACHB-1406]MBD2577534.1 molybdenum cofactor guanylyltransferase [Oscillatoria sp. FACHB-1406]
METKSLNLIALILAGGNSSRMGRDKALIPWEGTPLLRRVGEVAGRCCSQVYVFASRSQSYSTLLQDCPNFSILEEATSGRGPLVAFADALTQLPPADWILLLACDLPQLDSAILQQWAAQLPQLPPDTLAWVPCRDGFWEPLCAFYRPALKPHLEAFIAAGGRSFQDFLSDLPAVAFPVKEAEARMLRNCNVPDDLREMNR